MNRKDFPKANATCKICGRPYYICKSCERMRSSGGYSWKFDCDTQECFKVFLTLKDFRDGSKTKAEARMSLESISLHDISMTEGVKAEVSDIMRKEKKRKNEKPSVSEDVPNFDKSTETQENVNENAEI